MDAASNIGFQIIADYLFGNNKVPQSMQSSKIAMTALTELTELAVVQATQRPDAENQAACTTTSQALAGLLDVLRMAWARSAA